MKDNRAPDDKALVPLVAMGDLVAAGPEADRVERILHGLALVAVQVVRGAEDASLSLVGPGGALTTPFFTGSLADKMDAVQYAVGQGPCLDAAEAQQWTAVVVRDLAEDTRWPDFAAEGVGVGARSVMCVSLFAGSAVGVEDARRAVGSLNIYSSMPAVFGESERDTALLLALYAGLALAATEAVDDAGEQVDQLKEAMATRTVIGQAQGILMERHKFTAGQAFDRLRAASMNLNRKLRDVAKELTETGEDLALTPRRRVASVESARMKALSRYDILDTPPEGAFDRIAAMAAKLFGVPMATVCMVDTDRVWFKASLGLSGLRQVGREPGLAASVILDGKPRQVVDARTDPRTCAHPLVTGEPGLQFYAAVPIVTSDGHRLGTVAVMDTESHEATPEQMGMLEDLAVIVMDELELRLSAINALRDARGSSRK